MAWSAIATAAVLFVVGVASMPPLVPVPSRELLPPKVDQDTTLSTELMPPSEHKQGPLTLLVINVFALKNATDEDSNDVLHNDILKEVPDDVSEPLAVFLLVVEADNETEPVNLDDVAQDFMAEGFTVEKITKDGTTNLVKIDLKLTDDEDLEDNAETSELEHSGKLMKLRRRRSAPLGADLSRVKRHLHRHGYGSNYGSNYGSIQPCLSCNGGGLPPQPVYPRPQPIYEPGQCRTCGPYNNGGNGGGGYGQGSSNAYASASASAQASASGYGGRY